MVVAGMGENRPLSDNTTETLSEQDLRDQLFRLQNQKSMGQLEATGKVRVTRKDLARVKTVLREKQG